MRGEIGRCDEPPQGVVTRSPAAIRAPERAFGARATGQASKGPVGRMASKQELSSFIGSTFRSVWSLELLLFLRRHRDRSWSPAEMVARLRGSELLVARGAQELFAAGLIEVAGDGSARYRPATPGLGQIVDEVETEYARRPDRVRRAIIAGASQGGDLAAFADAFKLRKE